MEAGRALEVLVVLVGVSVAVPVRAGDDPAAEIARFAGAYVYVGGDVESDQRRAAIESTCQRMIPGIRALCNKRIFRATDPPERWVIDVDGEDVTIGHADGEGTRSPWDGTAVDTIGDGGGEQAVTRQLDGGCLVHHAQQAKGSGNDRFCLSADGNTVTVTVTVASNFLPDDVVYTLTYQRE